MPAVIRTCRDKAIAVFQGKAEQEMCLPQCMRRLVPCPMVLEATPEIVLIVDSAFQIIEFNKRAEDVLVLTNQRLSIR